MTEEPMGYPPISHPTIEKALSMKVIEDPNCPPDTMYLIPAQTWGDKWFRDLLESLKQDYERQLVALWNNGDEDD